MYGWSVRLPVGTGQHSFPGCIAMVEEGNLGFLLKSHQAEHSLKKAVRARGVKGDKRGRQRQDGPTASTSKAERDDVAWKGGRK